MFALIRRFPLIRECDFKIDKFAVYPKRNLHTRIGVPK
jgi:hypothetical protein